MFLDVAPGYAGGGLVIAFIATGIVVALLLVLFFVIRYNKKKK